MILGDAADALTPEMQAHFTASLNDPRRPSMQELQRQIDAFNRDAGQVGALRQRLRQYKLNRRTAEAEYFAEQRSRAARAA